MVSYVVYDIVAGFENLARSTTYNRNARVCELASDLEGF